MFTKSCRPFDNPALAQEPLLASEDFALGNFERALERSERFVLLVPQEAWAWRFKGECLFSLGRYEEASLCFQKALDLGGIGTQDTFLWQAIALERTGDLDAARDTLETALAGSDEVPLELLQKAKHQLQSIRSAA